MDQWSYVFIGFGAMDRKLPVNSKGLRPWTRVL